MRLKSQARRQHIIDRATEIFIERGYARGSLSLVASATGGSKSTVYNYFRNKEELFLAIMLERGAMLFNPVFDAFTGAPDLVRALESFALGLLGLLTRPPVLAFRRMIHAEGARSDLGRLYFENGPGRNWSRVAGVLALAMEQGRMRPSDPWVAAMHFQGLCEAGPYQRLLEGACEALSEDDLAKIAREATEVFARAYDLGRAEAEAQGGL